MVKTIKEINEKIKKGRAIVVDAEEIIDLVARKGIKKTAQEVDVVTTGTFSPMCSSGAYFNIGHSKPKIKAGGGTAFLNDIPAYTGFAAADLYIGAAALAGDDPKNKIHPGRFRYGGGHVIEDLVSGKDIRLNIVSYGTDCYPRQKLDTLINIKDINEAVLFNPRNCYQNYNVGINLSDEIIYTYMGVLKPGLGNANYCSAGQLSPLLNDPFYKTIGIGTRIFLGGGVGYVAWQGTQHNPQVVRTKGGVPKTAAGTIAVMGDLKKMSSKYLKGASILGYGVSLTVGIGIPIPVLNEEVCRYAAVKDEDIYTRVVDYSKEKSKKLKVKLPEVNYAELKSGTIKIRGKEVPTASLSSYIKAKEIAGILKEWIKKGRFLLSEPVDMLPGPGEKQKPKSLKERPIK
ncbi:MAG: homocysteine biosynthesis protein [Candidatus Omnitrophica bacterium]|nr:homocysteine biosynthesis protein [Candidatus Omnitrophota bacterium]